MMLNLNFIAPLQAIEEPFLIEKGIKLYVLRLDLNHPEISGNKIYKLKYNLDKAKQENKNTILTFGGAFSNHIAATAAAGKENGFKTIGIIRGDKLAKLNPTLQLAEKNGMQLDFVSRELYRNKIALMDYVNNRYNYDSVYIIPEGGSNELGVKGCTEIVEQINIDFDFICAPCGTGATISGIILSLNQNQKAIGFQVLKAENYIKNEVANWLNTFDKQNTKNWKINEDYHFGGYAKTSAELLNFVSDFKQKHNIQLDYIYTGKMMFGIYDLINKSYFEKGKTIVVVHTGGLQGNKRFYI